MRNEPFIGGLRLPPTFVLSLSQWFAVAANQTNKMEGEMARSKDSDDRDQSEDKGKVDWSKRKPYQDDANRRTGQERDDNPDDEYRSGPTK